jgi:hypothetical protein
VETLINPWLEFLAAHLEIRNDTFGSTPLRFEIVFDLGCRLRPVHVRFATASQILKGTSSSIAWTANGALNARKVTLRTGLKESPDQIGIQLEQRRYLERHA